MYVKDEVEAGLPGVCSKPRTPTPSTPGRHRHNPQTINPHPQTLHPKSHWTLGRNPLSEGRVAFRWFRNYRCTIPIAMYSISIAIFGKFIIIVGQL